MRVNAIDDRLPPGEGGLAVQFRRSRIVCRHRMRDACSFGDNEADPSGCTPLIISGYICAGHAALTEIAGHGRHHDAIGQTYAAQVDGLIENVEHALPIIALRIGRRDTAAAASNHYICVLSRTLLACSRESDTSA